MIASTRMVAAGRCPDAFDRHLGAARSRGGPEPDSFARARQFCTIEHEADRATVADDGALARVVV